MAKPHFTSPCSLIASFHTISESLINMSLPWGESCMRGWKQKTWQPTVSVRPSNGCTVTLSFCVKSLHETYSKKYFLPDRTINEVLHQQLRVVFFIYNCYVCFNGNKLTRFFDTPPPKLSDYLARWLLDNTYRFLFLYNSLFIFLLLYQKLSVTS